MKTAVNWEKGEAGDHGGEARKTGGSRALLLDRIKEGGGTDANGMIHTQRDTGYPGSRMEG